MGNYRKFELTLSAEDVRDLLRDCNMSPLVGSAVLPDEATMQFRIEPIEGGTQRDPELVGLTAVWWDPWGSRESDDG